MAPSILRSVSIGLASAVGLYAIIIGALLTPDLQRFAVYANKFNTLFIHDINKPEQFGFAKNQVTPFYIRTPDGETLYAWHVLPVNVYAVNEKLLLDETRPQGHVEDFTKTQAFRLLTSNETRVVVSYIVQEVHGNAGHLAQGWRPDTFRSVTTQPNTHVVTIDYRGFGKSTGHPTEAGLIEDGTTLVNWVLNIAKIPPERVVVLGQSLGTAVASAVALRFADPSSELIPRVSSAVLAASNTKDRIQSTIFSGIVLVAPFSSLPSLLLTYRIGGFLPILLPLRPFPALARHLTSQMVDKWPTADRLAAYYSACGSKNFDTSGGETGSLQLFHSINDFDISYHQTEIICQNMLGTDVGCIDGSRGAAVLDVRGEDRPHVRFEILSHGGHNRIITFSPVAVAIMRAFESF